jgi:hypothetical protein
VSDFDFEALISDPRPDEEMWDAYLTFALGHIGGLQTDGMRAQQLEDLEGAVGHELPFEVGLLLVMGVPASKGWRRWRTPEADWAEWNSYVLDGLCFGVENNNFWSPAWGDKPATLSDQLEVARHHYGTSVPALFPLFGHRAVPLTVAEGETSSMNNPVFSVVQTDVVTYGDDLAAWMHREFDVPLPMWPAQPRRFPFWTEVIEA